jgi:hypothetical protein
MAGSFTYKITLRLGRKVNSAVHLPYLPEDSLMKSLTNY